MAHYNIEPAIAIKFQILTSKLDALSVQHVIMSMMYVYASVLHKCCGITHTQLRQRTPTRCK